jgi:single-stranded DNA-binding protein
MSGIEMGHNQVIVSGILDSEFVLFRSMYGEDFYQAELAACRNSGRMDRIPILVSDRLTDISRCRKGQSVRVIGQFRSYNQQEGDHIRLLLMVFAQEFTIEEEKHTAQDNAIFVDGFLCKQATYRKTPLGREIADFLIAVNRPFKKTDYLPCVCWGRNARYAQTLHVGSRIQLWGRIQSRVYKKKVTAGDETDIIEKTAYEVSANRMECSATA